jgi:hypothetical protein
VESDTKIDIAELAVKRYLEKWSRKMLAQNFKRSENTIASWLFRMKKRDFKFKDLSPRLRAELLNAVKNEAEKF